MSDDGADSSDPDGSADELDPEEVESVRSDAIDRAERTLDVQRERFDRIDEKAAKLFRFTAVLSGTLFAVLGFAPGSASRVSVLIEGASATTVVSLTIAGAGFLATVLLAANVYVTTRYRSSFSRGSVSTVMETDMSTSPYQFLVLSSYKKSIGKNRKKISRNNRQFVTTLCLLVASVLSLAVAGVSTVLGPSPEVQRAIFGVVAVVYVVFLISVIERTTLQNK